MTVRDIIRLVVAFGAAPLLVIPEVSRAQGRGDAVPRDVVSAILRNYQGPANVEVLPDNRMPDSIASRVSLPPGARVIAVLEGNGTQVIGSVDGDADSVRLWFAGEFERRGMLPAESFGSFRPAFRPADPSPSNGGYCTDGRHFSVSAQDRGQRLVEFVLVVSRSSGCRAPGRRYPVSGTSSRGSDAPDLPLLLHPRSAEVTMRCASPRNNADSRSTDASISTTLGAEQLLATYGRQLDSLGWTPDVRNSAVATWTKPDSVGQEVRLILTVHAGPGGSDCRIVEMTSMRISR